MMHGCRPGGFSDPRPLTSLPPSLTSTFLTLGTACEHVKDIWNIKRPNMTRLATGSTNFPSWAWWNSRVSGLSTNLVDFPLKLLNHFLSTIPETIELKCQRWKRIWKSGMSFRSLGQQWLQSRSPSQSKTIISRLQSKHLRACFS